MLKSVSRSSSSSSLPPQLGTPTSRDDNDGANLFSVHHHDIVAEDLNATSPFSAHRDIVAENLNKIELCVSELEEKCFSIFSNEYFSRPHESETFYRINNQCKKLLSQLVSLQDGDSIKQQNERRGEAAKVQVYELAGRLLMLTELTEESVYLTELDRLNNVTRLYEHYSTKVNSKKFTLIYLTYSEIVKPEIKVLSL